MIGCAAILVQLVRFEFVFVGMVSVDMAQIAFVEIVGVAIMLHRSVTTVGAVHMRVPFLLNAS